MRLLARWLTRPHIDWPAVIVWTLFMLGVVAAVVFYLDRWVVR